MRRARGVLACLLAVVIPLGGLPADASPVRKAANRAAAVPAAALVPPGPAVPGPASKGQQTASAPKSKITAYRTAELTELRTETTKRFRMSDGTVEAELSAGPVHYRDEAGRWQDIDTRVGASDRPGYGFGNSKNGFRSDFGKRSDQLVGFEADGRSISLGVAGAGRAVTPTVKGNQVTYPDVFGEADVRYRVGPKSLKEEILLDEVPEVVSYTFDLRLTGLNARGEPDGSIGFYRNGDASERPAYVMPKPYMTDSAKDPLSPYGTAWSDKVTQTVTQKGSNFQITVTADRAWLTAAERVYPIAIDPTIEVVPDPAAAQDAMIYEGSPTGNYGGTSTLNVGNSSAGANSSRGLVKFDLSPLQIPSGTQIKSASLDVYFSQPHTSESVDVALEARKVTADWTESTATWAGMNTS